LLIVMTIAATIALIAVPRYFNSLDTYHADSATHRMLADLGFARSIARTENRTVVVTFDVVDDFYAIKDEPDPIDPEQPYTIDLAAEPYMVDVALVDFDGGTDVAFDAYGVAVRADDGLPLTKPGLVVVRSGDVVRAVNIDQMTGRASIGDEPTE
jgi:hypothetical protein